MTKTKSSINVVATACKVNSSIKYIIKSSVRYHVAVVRDMVFPASLYIVTVDHISKCMI